MNIWMVLKIIDALTTAAAGLLAPIRPGAIYGFTGLTADGLRGTTEIRAIFGGLFIALSIAPLFLGLVAIKCLALPIW